MQVQPLPEEGGRACPDRSEAFERRDRTKRDIAASLRKEGSWVLAAKIAACQTFFQVFQSLYCHCSAAFPKTCGVRICPHDQNKAKSRMLPRAIEVFKKMINPKMITLTIPNVERLTGDTISGIVKSFRKFRSSKAYKAHCRGGQPQPPPIHPFAP